MNVNFPQRIVCMTEESVETIYALGLEERIVGVSSYVRRPEAATKKPKISVFTHAQLEKIVDLRPDLVLGFSDIQKDIAKDLIGMGLNVFIANQRSINEILNYILTLGGILGVPDKAQEYVDSLIIKLGEAKEFGNNLKVKPRVYIEEWPDPMICGIQWFSELIELCGGEDILASTAHNSLGKDRIISHEQVIEANPDIMFGCWCGKPVDMESIKARDGYSELKFIRSGHLYELEPEIFLQPGPAPIVSGVDIIKSYYEALQN